jgi:hypothetical protein
VRGKMKLYCKFLLTRRNIPFRGWFLGYDECDQPNDLLLVFVHDLNKSGLTNTYMGGTITQALHTVTVGGLVGAGAPVWMCV